MNETVAEHLRGYDVLFVDISNGEVWRKYLTGFLVEYARDWR